MNPGAVDYVYCVKDSDDSPEKTAPQSSKKDVSREMHLNLPMAPEKTLFKKKDQKKKEKKKAGEGSFGLLPYTL